MTTDKTQLIQHRSHNDTTSILFVILITSSFVFFIRLLNISLDSGRRNQPITNKFDMTKHSRCSCLAGHSLKEDLVERRTGEDRCVPRWAWQ